MLRIMAFRLRRPQVLASACGQSAQAKSLVGAVLLVLCAVVPGHLHAIFHFPDQRFSIHSMGGEATQYILDGMQFDAQCSVAAGDFCAFPFELSKQCLIALLMSFPCSSLLNYPLLERRLEAAIVTVTARGVRVWGVSCVRE